MSIINDPTHPLYPAFEFVEDIPSQAWMVLYEGLSGSWLATNPFYNRKSAIKMGSQFDRGVKIIELTVTNSEDIPMDVRLKHRGKKTKKVRAVQLPPSTIKKIKKVRRIVEEYHQRNETQ